MAAKKKSKNPASAEKRKATPKPRDTAVEAVPDPPVVAVDAAALTPEPAESTDALRNEPAADQTAASQNRVYNEATPSAEERAATGAKVGKVSALDAAARVLQESGLPMTCSEMIGTMAEKGYWTSPGGKTPSATLYSAILRELKTKGSDARFVKTERGKFARASAV
jgi:HB1/ASXL restriction endonuclease-like protein with HTH domain